MSKPQTAKSANVQNSFCAGTMVNERLRRATLQFASSSWESRDEEVRAKEQPNASRLRGAIRGGNYEIQDSAIRNRARATCGTIDTVSAWRPDASRPVTL